MCADSGELDIPTIPRRLLEQASKGKLVLFVGSGASAGAAGGPSWRGLLEDLVTFADDEGIKLEHRTELDKLITDPAGDLILAADYLRTEVGEADFKAFIKRRFDASKMRVQKVHKAISELPLAGVVTTNFDTLIEGSQSDWVTILPRDDDPVPPEDGKWIIKLHGCATKPTTVVLAAGDYDALMADEAFQSALTVLYRTHTFLFVGFGLTDPDTVALLKALRAVSKGLLPHHYALVNGEKVGDIRAGYLEKTLGVRALTYTPKDRSHPEVAAFLGRLAVESGRRHVRRTLLVIKGCDNGGCHRVLVTRGSAGWTHEGERCFMLPNVPAPTDGDDFGAQIAKLLGVAEDRLRVSVVGAGFSTKVRKPEKVKDGETGRYTFEVVTVAFEGDTEGFGSKFRTLHGRGYTWEAMSTLRAHDATAQLNDEAFEYLSDELGSTLDKLPDAVVLSADDVTDDGQGSTENPGTPQTA